MDACPNCPVCQTTERTLFKEHDGWTFHRCNNCGLVYLDPMPGEAEFGDLYTSPDDSHYKGYFDKAEKKLKRSRRRARTLSKFVERPEGRKPRLLDIGCNAGYFLEAARELGFDCWGIELDPVSLNVAKKLYPQNHYHQGTLEDFAPEADGEPVLFDAAYCSEVIEHVPNVRGFVQEIRSKLLPGAVLYLTTPDVSHWRVPANILEWDGFAPPGHCVLFSPENLIQLLNGCGFELIRQRVSLKPGIKVLVRAV